MLESAREELAAALDELRELARGIHPAVLTDRSLTAALEALASRSPIPVEIDAPENELPRPVEAAAYYVVAEALANVAKYAGASGATVRICRENGRALVEVVTTASVAPTRRPARACAASPTAWRRSAAPSPSPARRAAAPASASRSRCTRRRKPRRDAKQGGAKRTPSGRFARAGSAPADSAGTPNRVGEAAPAEACAPHGRGPPGVRTCGHGTPTEEERDVRRTENRSRAPPGDGIDVTLWWDPADDSVAVEVLHLASDSSFELAVDRASALDAYYHPFAYAARRSPEAPRCRCVTSAPSHRHRCCAAPVAATRAHR